MKKSYKVLIITLAIAAVFTVCSLTLAEPEDISMAPQGVVAYAAATPDAAGNLVDTSTYIYAETYKGRTDIKTVSLPNATYIGDSAFYGCAELTSVVAPDVTATGKSVFVNCRKLTDAIMPKLRIVSEGVFAYCVSLCNFTFDSVESISSASITEGAFGWCGSLLEVNAPKLTEIGDYSFYVCNNLKTINAPALLSVYSNAFASCEKLETIDAPILRSINNSAFIRCTNLVTVNAPSVEYVAGSAFLDCMNLQSLSFPAATSFVASAVKGCNALTSLRLDSLTRLETAIPAVNLKKLALPSVSLIEQNAFQYNSELEALVVGSSFAAAAGETTVPNNAQLTVYTPSGTENALRTRIPGGTLYTHIETYDGLALKDIFIDTKGTPKSCVAHGSNAAFSSSNPSYIAVDSSGNCSAAYISEVAQESSATITGKMLVDVGGFNNITTTDTCAVRSFTSRAFADSLADGSTATMGVSSMYVYSSNDLNAGRSTINKSNVPTFTFISHDENWYKITYDGNTAFIPKPYIRLGVPTPTPPPGTSVIGTVAANTLIYAMPDSNSGVIGQVHVAGQVIIHGQFGDFYYISVGGTYGYVLKSSVSNISAGPIPTITPTPRPSYTPSPTRTPRPTKTPAPQPGGDPNPGGNGGNDTPGILPVGDNFGTPTDEGIKMKLKINGVETEVLLALNNFTYDYSTPEIVTTITSYQLRKGPDASFGTYQRVKKGAELKIIGRDGRWLKVDMGNGKVAYILEDMTR